MEAMKESGVDIKDTFVNHVFKYDTDSKNEIINLFQYTLISFILVVILNKFFQIYIPEADESKHYTTLIFEMLIQVIGLFLGMIIIHRIVTYLPTYTKTSYREINMLGFVIPFLVILLSLQTKLGDKVNIIMDNLGFINRFTNKHQGVSDNNSNANGFMVSQPLSHVPIQPLQNDFASQLLPTPGAASTQIPQLSSVGIQDSDPSQGASGIGLIPSNDEPMAANAALGMGSSW
jgi:glucan phosphoethanolaminetransferase (alkaline phosphatase superfamily)